jgi:hypothetical protein
MSLLWRLLFNRKEPWYEACYWHDWDYWVGGCKDARYLSDIKLAYRVKATGHPLWARLMYIAVRIGGSPWLPFSWRWGFRYPYGRGYE